MEELLARRVVKAILLLSLLLSIACTQSSLAADSSGTFYHYDWLSRSQIQSGFEVAFNQGKTRTPWTDKGLGKHAVEDGEASFQVFFELSHRLRDTVHVHIAGEASAVGHQPLVGLTEAFIHWRQVPQGPVRWQVKLGGFYPPLSLENDLPGWRSPYTQTFSAINSWVAEEVRILGSEVSMEWRPWAYRPDRIELGGAAFWGNDPIGGILTWRGWSMHSQQSRLADQLVLQPLPQLQEGGLFGMHDSGLEPLVEVDNRPGFYAFAQWRSPQVFNVRVLHYDNRADPTAFSGGQYAWDTQFTAAGVRARIAGLEVIAQWLDGDTLMGDLWQVDADFQSWFVMLSKSWGDHRISARYDDFEVEQFDNTPMDSNTEEGNGLTLSYRWQVSDQWQVYAEWVRNRTFRPGWMYNQASTRASESLFKIGFSWRS